MKFLKLIWHQISKLYQMAEHYSRILAAIFCLLFGTIYINGGTITISTKSGVVSPITISSTVGIIMMIIGLIELIVIFIQPIVELAKYIIKHQPFFHKTATYIRNLYR